MNLVSDGISEGKYRSFNESRGMPIARGGADVCLLLRWCSSCLANSSSTKSNRSSVVHSSRSIPDSGRHVGSVKKDIVSSGGSTYLDDQDTFSSSSKRAEPQECTSGYTIGFQEDSSGRAATRLEGSWRDAAPEAVLDNLLLGCSNKRRPQQPPLWAGEMDVSSLREGLDYRIDWRADWDIGDGHVDPPAAEEGASSSTVVDSSSSEEEETSAEEREARRSKDGNTFAGSTETEHAGSGGGFTAGRRAGAPAECYGEAASGVDETNVRPQEKKKSLRERLLSSASAGRATGGREQTQPSADGKQERVSDYFEELLVDQQLRDFLQGLFTTVRHTQKLALAKAAPATERDVALLLRLLLLLRLPLLGRKQSAQTFRSSGDVEHDAQERQRTPWLGGGVLSESERLREEVVDDGEDESNWPSAAEVKEATAAVKAALSHEAPDCWSVGAAALHAATDALPAVAAGEGSLDVGGRRSTSQSPRRQLSLLTAAAAAFPFSEAHEEGQYTFVENTEGRCQRAGLVTEMPERFPRLQAQEMSQQRTSVSPQTCEQQGPSESEDAQRVRLVQLLRLVAGAASEDKSQGASPSSEIPSSTS
eukprot:XP_028343252.1 uncharacterized protein LOC114485655 [Physeter catodon]